VTDSPHGIPLHKVGLAMLIGRQHPNQPPPKLIKEHIEQAKGYRHHT
jgi:hypothetical protein